MQEHPTDLDEEKAARAVELLKRPASARAIRMLRGTAQRLGLTKKEKVKTWREELTPLQYAEGAIAELKNQLLTACSETKKNKLQMGIRRWELAAEKLR